MWERALFPWKHLIPYSKKFFFFNRKERKEGQEKGNEENKRKRKQNKAKDLVSWSSSVVHLSTVTPSCVIINSDVLCSCVCFCLYGHFNSISFHKFYRQLFAFSLCSSGLISALLVLSTIYLFMNASLSPDVILCG